MTYRGISVRSGRWGSKLVRLYYFGNKSIEVWLRGRDAMNLEFNSSAGLINTNHPGAIEILDTALNQAKEAYREHVRLK